jgi:pimeloyl-ACP methyl ester carboxylesterase
MAVRFRSPSLPTFILLLLAGLPATAAAQRVQVDSFVTGDGVRVRYLLQGAGAPLVLIHGFALSAELNWVAPGAIDSLATRFRVIAPDLRGHGGSGKPHDPSAYGSRLVDDVVGLLDHLQIGRAHVAGYSLGGTIALRVAASHPDRVISAVLGGAGWPPPGTPPPPFLAQWLERLDAAARAGTSVADALWRPDMAALPPAIRAALDRNDAAAIAAALRSVAALAVPEAEVRALRIPLLAVVGELDPVRAAVDALQRVLPSLSVTVLAGADHAGAMADPRLAAAIRAFALSRP